MNRNINIILNGFKEKVLENTTISFLISHFKEGSCHGPDCGA